MDSGISGYAIFWVNQKTVPEMDTQLFDNPMKAFDQ